MTEPIIEAQDLHKSFGPLDVLRGGVSLQVFPGEVVVIIGPSGSGKSTLLRCLNYLEQPCAGSVRFENEPIDPKTNLRRVRQEMGMVFQSFNLFPPHLKVLDNITLAPRRVRSAAPPARARQQALELLSRVGLEDKADSYPDELSGGQRQRVAIARALAMHPKVLLLTSPPQLLIRK